MSRVRAFLTALGMAFALPTVPTAADPAALARAQSAAADQSTLAGTWQSAADETPLNAPHQEAIWGKNAKEVRTVRMVARSAGDATLTVTRKVVDARGRTVSGTTSNEQADVQIGSAGAAAGPRIDLPVTLKRAERRYPGDPAGNWSIDGLRVTVTAFADDASKLEVRFDYPDGRGSFWDELRRAAQRPKAAAPAANSGPS